MNTITISSTMSNSVFAKAVATNDNCLELVISPAGEWAQELTDGGIRYGNQDKTIFHIGFGKKCWKDIKDAYISMCNDEECELREMFTYHIEATTIAEMHRIANSDLPF